MMMKRLGHKCLENDIDFWFSPVSGSGQVQGWLAWPGPITSVAWRLTGDISHLREERIFLSGPWLAAAGERTKHQDSEFWGHVNSFLPVVSGGLWWYPQSLCKSIKQVPRKARWDWNNMKETCILQACQNMTGSVHESEAKEWNKEVSNSQGSQQGQVSTVGTLECQRLKQDPPGREKGEAPLAPCQCPPPTLCGQLIQKPGLEPASSTLPLKSKTAHGAGQTRVWTW